MKQSMRVGKDIHRGFNSPLLQFKSGIPGRWKMGDYNGADRNCQVWRMLDRMKTVTGTQPLSIAYTPDSDDAFTFYAWQHGLVTLEAPGFQPEFHRDHVIALNRAAAEQAFDVVAVSSVAYPSLAGRYWILSVGNSVG